MESVGNPAQSLLFTYYTFGLYDVAYLVLQMDICIYYYLCMRHQ